MIDKPIATDIELRHGLGVCILTVECKPKYSDGEVLGYHYNQITTKSGLAGTKKKKEGTNKNPEKERRWEQLRKSNSLHETCEIAKVEDDNEKTMQRYENAC